MKICWFKISVKEIDKSLTFYKELLGQPLLKRFRPNDRTEIAFLGRDEFKVELVYSLDQEAAGETRGLSIAFECDDIEKFFKKVKDSGIAPESKIMRPNPQSETAFFYIRDPDGIQIQIVQPDRSCFL